LEAFCLHICCQASWICGSGTKSFDETLPLPHFSESGTSDSRIGNGYDSIFMEAS